MPDLAGGVYHCCHFITHKIAYKFVLCPPEPSPSVWHHACPAQGSEVKSLAQVDVAQKEYGLNPALVPESVPYSRVMLHPDPFPFPFDAFLFLHSSPVLLESSPAGPREA